MTNCHYDHLFALNSVDVVRLWWPGNAANHSPMTHMENTDAIDSRIYLYTHTQHTLSMNHDVFMYNSIDAREEQEVEMQIYNGMKNIFMFYT